MNSLTCNVCGNQEASYSCNAVVCLNCRTFFIRSCMKFEPPICKKRKQCKIYPSPKANCASCRLDRCHLIGMILPEVNKKKQKPWIVPCVPPINDYDIRKHQLAMSLVPPGLRVMERLNLAGSAFEFASHLVEFDIYITNLDGLSPSIMPEVNNNVSLLDVLFNPEICASRQTASWDISPLFEPNQKYSIAKSYLRQITLFADLLNCIDEIHQLPTVDKIRQFQFNFADVVALTIIYFSWRDPYLYTGCDENMERFDMPEAQYMQWKKLFISTGTYAFLHILPLFHELQPSHYEVAILKLISALNICPELSEEGRLICQAAKLKYQSILAELIRDTRPELTFQQVAYRLKQLLKITTNVKKISEMSQLVWRSFVTEDFGGVRGQLTFDLLLKTPEGMVSTVVEEKDTNQRGPKEDEDPKWWSCSRNALCLAVASFAAHAMITVYNTYYLKVFLEKYHLPPVYVNYVQTAFLVWNAINDPIMGYVQDLGCCGMKWIMDRRKVMLYMGPIFAGSFLLFWFPWSTSSAVVAALQLLVALFVYDTLFTLVLSAYCGLCVEKAPTHSSRVRVTIFGEIFGLIGGCLILPVESFTHNLDYFGRFQLFCVGIAILAGICFIVCATQISHEKPEKAEVERMQHAQELPGTFKSVATISWQIVKEPRFICLVGASFFKNMRFIGNEQFLILFVEGLLVQAGFMEKGSPLLGLYYVAVRSAGSILFLSLWYPVNRFGCHKILHFLNAASVISAIVTLFMGRTSLGWLATFIFFENIFSRCGVYGYYMIIAGEVIDSDRRNHDRSSPLSTIIFTLKALFDKPAESLAPILILSFLQSGSYTQLKDSCYSSGSIATTTGPPIGSCDDMFNSMFYTLVLFPTVCAIGEAIFIAIDQFCKSREGRDLKEGVELK